MPQHAHAVPRGRFLIGQPVFQFFGGLIGGCIIRNHDLERCQRLRQRGGHGLLNHGRTVVSRNRDRYRHASLQVSALPAKTRPIPTNQLRTADACGMN